MTTPDIAGLCERLRARATGAYCLEAADTLERQAADIERLREALGGINQLARDRLALIPADLVCGGVVGDLLVDILGRAALTGEDTATLSLSGKTQTRGDACTS